MFLKHRYRLGYESLCREVSDSITWRRFCRIGIDTRVPHPTTLMKLTTRCGTAAVDGLNQALLDQATAAKLLRTGRVRADTTVLAADVAYRPTRACWLGRSAGSRPPSSGCRPPAGQPGPRCGTGTGAGRPVGVRTRSAPRCVPARRRTATTPLAAVRKVTGELADLAERAAADADRLLANARRALSRARVQARERGADADAGRRRGPLARAVNDLAELLAAARQIAAQTRQRLAGITPDGATRRVSLHDGDARPIAKGRLGKPVEFGYKTQIVEGADGVVLDHTTELGNPPDAPQLAPAIDRVTKRTRRTPRTVTADRGYGEASAENAVRDLGVRTVVIPARADPAKPAKQSSTDHPFGGS